MTDEINIKVFVDNKSVSLYEFTINDNYTGVNTASFRCKEKLPERYDVHIKIDKVVMFGGVILDRKQSPGSYSYECSDYSELLQSDIKDRYTNKRVDQIAKDIITDKGKGYLKTGGITKTKKKHPVLAWKNTKAYNVLHQLANLEDKMRFSVNADGVCILEKIPKQEKGYVFTGGNITDYDIEYDSSNIITGVRVYGKDDNLLYTYDNGTLTNKYGIIREIIEDSNISSKSIAKNKAAELFNKKKKRKISAVITLPTILPKLKSGQWCGFMPFADGKGSPQTYFVNTVTTKGNSNSISQTVALLDGKPETPSDWIYTPPNESSSSNCVKKTVSNPQTVYGSCDKCSYNPPKAKNTVSFRDYCPFCNKEGVLKFTGVKGTSKTDAPEGQWTCKLCNADFCAKCGYDKWSPPREKLEKSSECVSAKGVETDVRNKAQELGDPYKIYKWIRQNIDYEFYYDNKYGYSSADVMRVGKGNCYVQSQLVVDMFKSIGVTAKRVCKRRCNTYEHCNVDAVINGQNYRIDTACGKGVYKKI